MDRYRYYASLPHLKGESKTVSVGSVSRIPATDIEDIIVKSVNEHLVAQHGQPSSSTAHADDRGVMIAERVVRIEVHKDRSPDEVVGGLRQASRTLRCPPRVIRLGHPAVRRLPPTQIPFRARARPPGTEFLDAETGRQKSPPKWVNAHRDKNPGNEWSEIPAETRYSA